MRQPNQPHYACVAFAAAMLLAAGSASAAERDPAGVRLTLLDSRYVVENERFTDVAAVATWVRTRETRVVAIDRCGATTTPQLLQAVERFSPTAPGTLEIRALPGEASTCAAAARVANEEWVGFLRASDYLVTDAEGRSIIP